MVPGVLPRLAVGEAERLDDGWRSKRYGKDQSSGCHAPGSARSPVALGALVRSRERGPFDAGFPELREEHGASGDDGGARLHGAFPAGAQRHPRRRRLPRHRCRHPRLAQARLRLRDGDNPRSAAASSHRGRRPRVRPVSLPPERHGVEPSHQRRRKRRPPGDRKALRRSRGRRAPGPAPAVGHRPARLALQ